jgi:hypothetical protein
VRLQGGFNRLRNEAINVFVGDEARDKRQSVV